MFENNWVVLKKKVKGNPPYIKVEDETESEYYYYDKKCNLLKVDKSNYYPAKVNIYIYHLLIIFVFLSFAFAFLFQYFNLALINDKNIILSFSMGSEVALIPCSILLTFSAVLFLFNYVKFGKIISLPAVILYIFSIILTMYLLMGYGYVKPDGIYIRPNLDKQENCLAWDQIKPIAYLKLNNAGYNIAYFKISTKDGTIIDLLFIPTFNKDTVERVKQVVQIAQSHNITIEPRDQEAANLLFAP